MNDYQVNQYDGENSKRTKSVTEIEVAILVKAIDKWFKYLVPYHNYYEDVEFLDGIKHFLNQDGCLSYKQIKRLENTIK